MGVYVKELYPIESDTGNRIMTLLIEHSFLKSVYFEIYDAGNGWKIYWNYEISPEEFFPVVREYVKPEMIFSDLVQDKTIQSKIRVLSHTFSKDLGEDEIAIIKDVISQGFPELTRRQPLGLDGHSYIFSIEGIEGEYRCWCVIPEEWSHIKSVIDMVIDIASLDDKYRISGIG